MRESSYRARCQLPTAVGSPRGSAPQRTTGLLAGITFASICIRFQLSIVYKLYVTLMSNQATTALASLAEWGNRPELVYAVLRLAILEQALPPGAKLPEDGIGEQLGVSRTVVRRALERLRAEELVTIEPNRGAAVARPSLEEARDVFAVRIELERIVVERTCGALDAPAVKSLETCIASEENAFRAGSPGYIRHAAEFHLVLAELTGSPLLLKYITSLVTRSALILGLYGRPQWPSCSIEEHRAVLDALIKGNLARAWQLMHEHLDSVLHRALATDEVSELPSVLEVVASYAAQLSSGAALALPTSRQRGVASNLIMSKDKTQ